jgi:hypothetical protein
MRVNGLAGSISTRRKERPTPWRTSPLSVSAQLTSHMGKLKVPQLCLAAFAAAWAIDGNARRVQQDKLRSYPHSACGLKAGEF